MTITLSAIMDKYCVPLMQIDDISRHCHCQYLKTA